MLMLVEPGSEDELGYKIDPAAKPKTLDIVRGDYTAKALYELDGDTLRVCMPITGGKDRPSEFKADGKSFGVVTLKRVKDEKKDEPKKAKDEELIVGTWRVEKYDVGVEDKERTDRAKKRVMTFTKDGTLTMTAEGQSVKREYKLDPSAKPKALDMIDKSGDGFTVPALYELDGDTLTICTQTGAGEGEKFVRPGGLKADAKKDVALLTLKRVKDAKPEEKNPKEAEVLLGAWRFEAIDTGGPGGPKEEELAKARMTFGKGDTMVLVEPDGKEREYTIKLDPAAKPKGIDLIEKAGTTLGVYELDGDTLRLALAQSGSDTRPAALKANGKGVVVITLKRVKEEKKEPKKDK